MPATLLDMTEVPITKILNYLDYPAIQNVRKTSRDLRESSDNLKINASPTTIIIFEYDEFITLSHISKSPWDYYPIGSWICLTYHNQENGCKINWLRSDGEREKLLENQHYAEVFWRDFEALLANKNVVLDLLHVNAFSSPGNLFLEKLEEKLKARTSNQVKSLIINVVNHSRLVPVLHQVDSIFLESLEIVTDVGIDQTLDISEIETMPHWKQVKSLNMCCLLAPMPIQKFANFSKCRLCFENVSVEMIKETIEIFFQSTDYNKTFNLHSCSDLDNNSINNLWGPPTLAPNDYFINRDSWYLKVENNSEKVLRMIIEYRTIDFKFVDKLLVPSHCEIID